MVANRLPRVSLDYGRNILRPYKGNRFDLHLFYAVPISTLLLCLSHKAITNNQTYIAFLIVSTRWRLTPKSDLPRRDAERT